MASSNLQFALAASTRNIFARSYQALPSAACRSLRRERLARGGCKAVVGGFFSERDPAPVFALRFSSSGRRLTARAAAASQMQAGAIDGENSQGCGEGDEGEGESVAPSWQLVNGINELLASGRYKAWLLDQFGVLHDGQLAYPGAVQAVQAIASSCARLALVSNSSRRAAVTEKKIPSLGFDPALFSFIITSGELTHQKLLRRDDPAFASLAHRCLHFTWSSRGAVSLEGLGLQVVDHPQDAAFLLAHGTEAIGQSDGSVRPASLDEMTEVLKRAAEVGREAGRSLPLVVANPDLVTVESRNLRVMPGTLGLKYREMGGEVLCMGKPDKVVYSAVLDALGLEPSECIMVGDSIEHDIKGACGVGMDSLFIAGGIHAKEVGIGSNGQAANKQKLEEFLWEQEWKPTYVASSFSL